MFSAYTHIKKTLINGKKFHRDVDVGAYKGKQLQEIDGEEVLKYIIFWYKLVLTRMLIICFSYVQYMVH